MEENIELIKEHALRKKEFLKKMEETKKIVQMSNLKEKMASNKNIAKVFTREERIEKVKFLSTQIVKFLEENGEVIFSDEINFFTTILTAKLKFKTGIK